MNTTASEAELRLWKRLWTANASVTDCIEVLMDWAPDDEDLSDRTDLKDIQEAYDAAVGLAAALEQLLIVRQRKDAKHG